MKHIKIVYGLFLIIVFFSCTKLEENFRGELQQGNTGNITAAELLISAYGSLNGPYQGSGDLFSAKEVTSDEIIVPTRGPDWDDNGQWRALFAHTWNADQGQLRSAFTGLLSSQFAASNVLQFSPS
ncbi:MAG: RagB/SusD family nutrient uptake outer membrane protein, partial [Bacteroidota bacterium]|nr:RagB/SusD family nutrient uptake outer membrane protein [Bacteroidota bacterium]